MPGSKKYRDEETLRRLYHDEWMSTIAIADEFDVSDKTIQYWMKKHGIERRDHTEKTAHPELHDADLLREWYHDEGLTTFDIADRIGCEQAPVWQAMNRHGTELRPPVNELNGEDHPSYKHGGAAYGKGWTEEKRERVRERDGRKCRVCGLSGAAHREKFGQRLHVHHIQPAHTVDDPDYRNSMDNLVTLCHPCHERWEGVPLCPQRAQSTTASSTVKEGV